MSKAPVIIIGTGLAGYNLAKEFRKLDQSHPLMLITKSRGRFYSKPLLSTALTKEKQAHELAVFTAEQMAEQLNATVLTKTTVDAIDTENNKIICGEQSYDYDRLVLANGADTIKLPVLGNAVTELKSVNDLEDYEHFREYLSDKKHIAIIGAGLVGCEFANDLANSGHRVSMVAMSRYPLDTLIPAEIGRVLESAFRELGIEWHMERSVREINHGPNKDFVISLTHEDTLQADAVLSAIGLRPHIGLAKEAGIEVNHGIIVDRYLETSAKNVFALGDCAQVNGLVMLFVAPLLHSARSLAKTLAGEKNMVHYPAMPVVIKTPVCPIAVIPPPKGIEVLWDVVGEGVNLKALCYDDNLMQQDFYHPCRPGY